MRIHRGTASRVFAGILVMVFSACGSPSSAAGEFSERATAEPERSASVPVALSTASATSTSPAPASAPGIETEATSLSMTWSGGRAEGRGPVRLKTFPLRTEEIGAITPMGLMVGGHVTPSQHLGISPIVRDVPPDRYDVLAPADGFIVSVQRVRKGNPDPAVQNRRYTGEYLVVIEHTGTFYTYIGLIERLESGVLAAMGGDPPPGPPRHTRIPVKAGQVIAKMGGDHGLDFGVVNTERVLSGFIRPEQFQNRDPMKPYMADPFDYVDEPLRTRLLTLNARKAAPFGGRIDYDQDGRLVGNWYREGSGGYAGIRGQMGYWGGHLTFAYHHIDPSRIIVSMGDFGGQPRQFWVKGNAPDPARIARADGIVRYELVFPMMGSDGRIYERPDADRVYGVVLAQLVEDRKLKVEIVPGGSADRSRNFTSAAVVYER
jgi:hypothetical protein